MEEKTTISYPENFELSYLPESQGFSGDGYFFKIETLSHENKIEYTRKAIYSKRIISEKTNIVHDLKRFLDKSTLGVLFLEK